MHNLRLIGLAIIGAALPFVSAQAETSNCKPISSVPATITAPGTYCLTGNLFVGASPATGSAIAINTNNVTLDLNGYTLARQAADTSAGRGILAYNQKNITVRNGRINGFAAAVVLMDTSTDKSSSGGHLVEGLRIDNSIVSGIEVSGAANVIRDNRIVDTGGAQSDDGVFGISVVAPATRVLNNAIFGMSSATSIAWHAAIYAYNAQGSVIENNRISGLKAPAPTRGISSLSHGIYVGDSHGSSIRNNSIANAAVSTASQGIYLTRSTNLSVRDNSVSNMANGISFNSGSTGIYMLNTVIGAAVSYSGGTAGVANAQ